MTIEDKAVLLPQYSRMSPTPDPHGQVALMLCESLLLLLVDEGVIRKDRAIDAITRRLALASGADRATRA